MSMIRWNKKDKRCPVGVYQSFSLSSIARHSRLFAVRVSNNHSKAVCQSRNSRWPLPPRGGSDVILTWNYPYLRNRAGAAKSFAKLRKHREAPARLDFTVTFRFVTAGVTVKYRPAAVARSPVRSDHRPQEFKSTARERRVAARELNRAGWIWFRPANRSNLKLNEREINYYCWNIHLR